MLAAGAGRASLESYFGVEGQKRAAFVLAHMKSQARAVKPKALGFIGREHLLAKLEEAGVALKTFDYRHAEFEHDGLPYVAEIAFGYCPDVKSRQIITGVNWSVAISANPFRSLGGGGESLDTMLAEQYAGPDEPVVTVLHLACPKVDYLDRGKSSIVIPGSAA